MKTRKKTITQRSRLRVGAWYQLHLEGVPFKKVCVIEMTATLVRLECPTHNLSDADLRPIDDLFIGPVCYFGGKLTRYENFFAPKFLGYGKPRWFWGRIRRWTNCFGTLYTQP